MPLRHRLTCMLIAIGLLGCNPVEADAATPPTAAAPHRIALALQGKHPRVQVQIEGIARPLSFVVDTAAGASVLDLATARQADLLASERTDNLVHGAGGSGATSGRTRPLSLQAGTLAIQATLLATDLSALGGAAGPPIDGILGNDVLARFDTSFDLAAGWLILAPPGSLDSTGCLANALPQRTAMLQRFGIVQAQLQDGTTVTPALAVVDTGAAQSVLNLEGLRALGLRTDDARLRPRASGTRGLGPTAVPTWLYTLPELRIGTWTQRAREVRVSDLPVFKVIGMDTRAALILGIDLLGDTPVHIPVGATAVCLGTRSGQATRD